MSNRFYDQLQKALRQFSGFLLVVIIATIFFQVVGRALSINPPWLEELSRYLFVAMIFLALNIVISDNILIRIDFIDNYIKGTGSKLLKGLSLILAGIIISVMMVSSVYLFRMGFKQTSAAMRIPMYIAYAPIPVGFALSLIEVFRKLAEVFRKGESA